MYGYFPHAPQHVASSNYITGTERDSITIRWYVFTAVVHFRNANNIATHCTCVRNVSIYNIYSSSIKVHCLKGENCVQTQHNDRLWLCVVHRLVSRLCNITYCLFTTDYLVEQTVSVTFISRADLTGGTFYLRKCQVVNKHATDILILYKQQRHQ